MDRRPKLAVISCLANGEPIIEKIIEKIFEKIIQGIDVRYDLIFYAAVALKLHDKDGHKKN